MYALCRGPSRYLSTAREGKKAARPDMWRKVRQLLLEEGEALQQLAGSRLARLAQPRGMLLHEVLC